MTFTAGQKAKSRWQCTAGVKGQTDPLLSPQCSSQWSGTLKETFYPGYLMEYLRGIEPDPALGLSIQPKDTNSSSSVLCYTAMD
jgi:hypothetical protein